MKYVCIVAIVFAAASFVVVVGMFLRLPYFPVVSYTMPPLIIVDLCTDDCGLGNQMFRYAAGLGLASQNPNYTACVFGLEDIGHLAHEHSAFVLDVLPSWRQLDPCPLFISSPRLPYFRRAVDFWPDRMHLFEPPHSTFREFRFDGSRPVLVAGCMQSFKYFQHLPHPFFRLKQQHSAREWLAEHGVSSVVHVRRGDKLDDGSPVVPLAYYENAIGMLGTTRVAVCTDDPSWVEHQAVFGNAVISRHHDPGFDMAVLAAATEAVIIGIGTFGWWGAYLSKAKRKYFYPATYIGELAAGYNESDYIPYGVRGQGDWIPVYP